MVSNLKGSSNSARKVKVQSKFMLMVKPSKTNQYILPKIKPLTDNINII